MMDDEKLIEGPIPMLLNLGNWGRPEEMIGYAHVFYMTDGRKRIEIVLSDEASQALTDLSAMFEIKGIGFAGVQRRGQDGG